MNFAYQWYLIERDITLAKYTGLSAYLQIYK